MRVEKFIVLDVEGMQSARPYNIGYIIADRKGKIYKRHSFAIPVAFWENIADCLKIGQAIDMTKKNIQEILADMDKRKRKRKYQTVSISEFTNIFLKEIQRYKVKRIFAYNVAFDKGAITRLLDPAIFNSLEIEWCDIISGILTTKLLTKKYVNWCIENNYLTNTGIASYKAEIVYKYLTNDLNFEEEHTGLSDTLIEYQILLDVFKSHKAVSFSPVCAWAKLKKFMTENNLMGQT